MRTLAISGPRPLTYHSGRRHRGSAASRGYAMNWMMPELPTEATARDWALAERYTRVTKAIDEDWPDAHSAWLTIGPQHFKVADCKTKEGAGWHCWMLAKAMRVVIDAAVTGTTIAGPTVA